MGGNSAYPPEPSRRERLHVPVRTGASDAYSHALSTRYGSRFGCLCLAGKPTSFQITRSLVIDPYESGLFWAMRAILAEPSTPTIAVRVYVQPARFERSSRTEQRLRAPRYQPASAFLSRRRAPTAMRFRHSGKVHSPDSPHQERDTIAARTPPRLRFCGSD